MRKRIRILILAAIVAAVVVPVGFALSLDMTPRLATSSSPAMRVPAADVITPSPIVATTTTALTGLPDVPDAAKLFAVGTALCGLAAAMRRRQV